MISATSLENAFRRQGVSTARELGTLLGVSQPTLSRMIQRLGNRVIRLGQGRATRYALKRPVGSLGDTWPVYAISVEGKPAPAGQLTALEAGQWAFMPDRRWEPLMPPVDQPFVFPGLPWFLDDLRPQGFLGRSFARRYGTPLGLPADPRLWNAEAVLTSLLQFGHDWPGSLILGERMLGAFQETLLSPPACIPAAERATRYPSLADAAAAGDVPDSSAGGDQPKFTACIQDADGRFRHVIVKFSGRGEGPATRRWADLLAAEHVAESLIAETGLNSAGTTLLEADGRRFLESTRFDRIDAFGRRGLVSLAALDAAFFGLADTPWTAAAVRLLETGWLPPEDARQLEVLWRFGNLIGNTDMHYGNVSLFLGGKRPLGLAPCYDMLPMLYRPDPEGELPARPFKPTPPPPEAMPAWSCAFPMAEQYWQRVAESGLVTKSFRELAGENGRTLSRYRQQFL